MFSGIRRLFSILYFMFARNWITMLGSSIATTSALAILFFFGLELTGEVSSPYFGILAFLIMPAVFVLGLALVPIGNLWRRNEWKHEHALDGEQDHRFPTIDFNKPAVRKAAFILGFLTFTNFFIISAVSYKGVTYMDSPQFCGQVCHTVMEPEFTAYNQSPHSRVTCTECHIGPGAPWFVQAKLSGARQVFAVLFDTYKRPIETPVHNLRPSRDICEECHWPEKFVGDRMRIITEYNTDEKNTPITTALLMHIGAGASEQHRGIHSWHIDPAKKTRYLATDERRLEIGVVRVTNPDGTVTNYTMNGSTIDPATVKDEDMREMDCIDCHNRPTHVYKMPNKALDLAISAGKIDKTLPYVKMVTLEALQAATGEGGEVGDLEKIAQYIRDYYKTNYAELATQNAAAIEAAVAESQQIYSSNVFPEMKVTWGTYPNHIGHVDSPGCFRCHDDNHATPAGDVIRQDCTICHAVLAMQEENPSILETLGMADPVEETATDESATVEPEVPANDEGQSAEPATEESATSETEAPSEDVKDDSAAQ